MYKRQIRLFADNFTSNYQEWVRRFDTLTESDRKAMRTKTDEFELKPLISVLMPTYNTPEQWLRKAIDSVRAQTYENWELCIADDASSDATVRRVLGEFAKLDSRIRFQVREKNGHIAAASQSALEMAGGEFIALLDHDDELAEHALWSVVDQINKTPDADLLYSDEDKLTSYGMRFNPHFKSNWNPELFLAQNFICHLSVFRTAVVREVGGFRCGFEGAQDWDLAWRVIDTIPESHICHIPHILYHWRVIEGSTAQSTAAKPYVLEAQRKVIVEHLERTNVLGAQVEVLHDISHQRVFFPVPDPQPLVSIIIPTKDQVDFLKRTIDSIIDRSSYKNFELIVVDNRSNKPETHVYLAKLGSTPGIKVLKHDEPFNFARINNIAVRETRGQLVAFLNNDLEVISKDWLEEMVSYAVQPQVGAVGARLWYPNYLLQHGGVVTGIGGIAGHNHKGRPKGDPGYFNRAILPQAMSGVTAACMVMRRAVFDQVGGFDEENFAVAFNDVDFCLRIRKAGYRVVYNPYAELFHHESISRGYENTPEKFQRFVREMTAMKTRWGKDLDNDPYYNPNLTLLTEDFTFAFPPRVQKGWE